MNFNDEQLNIINEGISNNILVSAAAGSGKTTVLTERIVRKLLGENCDNQDISLTNILVMTFTKKATAEMKARIKQKLEEQLSDSKFVKKLIKESAIIQNANILTIDAFCKKVLEENYTALTKENSLYHDFDLTYRIADANEIAVLYDDVIDSFLESNYLNEKYKDIFDNYIDKTNEDRLRALLLNGLGFLTSVTWPDEYLTAQILDFDANSKKAYEEYVAVLISDLALLKNEIEQFMPEIDRIYNLYKDTLAGGVNQKGNKITDKGKEALADGITYLDEVIKVINEFCKFGFINKNNEIDLDEFKNIYQDIKTIIDKKPVYPTVSYINGIDKDDFDAFKEEYSGHLSKLNIVEHAYVVFNFTDDKIINSKEKLFLEFLRDFYLQVVLEKRKRNLYEISDYARMTLDILYDKNVDKSGHITRTISARAHDIGDRYKLVFIDEYQDTNFIQEKILAALTNDFKKGNLFMVGDVKQSIYGFRNAEPSIFVNKYNDFACNKGGVNKTLSINYRSTKEIIGYVNDLFSKTMTPKFGDINYSDGNALGLREAEEKRDIINDNKVEIHVVYKKDGAEGGYSGIEYEADFVAKEIKKIVEEKKCKYRDIVILLRNAKGKAKIFEDALKRHKIPSYAEQKTGFFEKLEIRLVVDILSIIDNPLQDLPVVAVLESSLFKVTNDELSLIKMMRKNDFIYDACVYMDNLLNNDIDIVDTEDKEKLENKINEYSIDKNAFANKLRKFLNSLADLQFKSRYFSISNLLQHIYDSLSVKEVVSAMPNGRQRSANLDVLYDSALRFEKSSYSGLFNFNRYIEKIYDVSVNQGEARIYDENSNVVRIMTIHTSKGLQFKNVFLCGCNTDYNFTDSNDKKDAQFDQEYGVGLDYYDKENKYVCNTAKKLLMAVKKKDETKLEELRMLYVALTRAESKLYIVGNVARQGSNGMNYNALTDFISKKDKGENIKLKLPDCECYLEVILSNYPVNDEKYCKFEDHEWEIKEEIDEVDDVTVEEVTKDVRNEQEIIDNNKEYFSSVELENIEQNLTDTYKYIDYQKLKPKFSVSAIKEIKIDALNEEAPKVQVVDEDDKDDARSEKRVADTDVVKGAELGNAYHRFMQFYDYKKNKYSCDKEKDSSVEHIVSKEKIDLFLKSTIGIEMASAFNDNKLFREQKFMKLYSQSEINKYIYTENEKITDLIDEVLNDKKVVVQGIIDAFYIKKDEKGNDYIVLVDYKTDGLSSDKIVKDEIRKMLVDRYQLQLEIYAEALKELTGLDVNEKYLYSFAIDEEIKLEEAK